MNGRPSEEGGEDGEGEGEEERGGGGEDGPTRTPTRKRARLGSNQGAHPESTALAVAKLWWTGAAEHRRAAADLVAAAERLRGVADALAALVPAPPQPARPATADADCQTTEAMEMEETGVDPAEAADEAKEVEEEAEEVEEEAEGDKDSLPEDGALSEQGSDKADQ